MMRSGRFWYSFCWALLLVSLCASLSPAAVIGDYRSVSIPCRDKGGTLQLAIRSFTRNGLLFYLLVDPKTLKSSIVPSSSLIATPLDADKLAATPFAMLLARSTTAPVRLQNDGITHAQKPIGGQVLTIDLCPSRRPTERSMFEALAAIARKTGKPTPIAVCITGVWLAAHRTDLDWLLEKEKRRELAITWVNHSFSHFYDPAIPLAKNFLLAAGTDFRRQVLANEQAMLENNLVPSPFFRFPGLVSDSKLIALLREYSLIPLGADAWLAKGEPPHTGSIILVHGNGNEPKGIAKLMPLITGAEPLHLFSLEEAMTGNTH